MHNYGVMVYEALYVVWQQLQWNMEMPQYDKGCVWLELTIEFYATM